MPLKFIHTFNTFPKTLPISFRKDKQSYFRDYIKKYNHEVARKF